MRSRGMVALFVLGWFFVGSGVAVVAAQCNNNAECGLIGYCQKSTGDCDGVGVCTARPSGCPDVWAPVCGCDGNTYGNNCEAAEAGINVAYQGQCLPPACQDNDDCEVGDFCQTPTRCMHRRGHLHAPTNPVPYSLGPGLRMRWYDL